MARPSVGEAAPSRTSFACKFDGGRCAARPDRRPLTMPGGWRTIAAHGHRADRPLDRRAFGLIAARTLSPVELVEALIRRVEDYDAQTHAFITPTFDLARQQARAAEAEIAAGKHRGTLHGIPFALKDIYDTRGILTSGHSRVFLAPIPAAAATV